MQFKVGNYRDGDRESNIRMLTGTIKADWIHDQDVTGQNSRSNYVVKQRSQFRSPIMGSDMALTAARASAAAGHVPSA